MPQSTKFVTAEWRPEDVQANCRKYLNNELTYLYKHLVDVNGILGTGFYKDGMDGVSVVLGILLWHLPVNTRGKSKILCCKMQKQILQFHALTVNHQIYFYSCYVKDISILWMILLPKVCLGWDYFFCFWGGYNNNNIFNCSPNI